MMRALTTSGTGMVAQQHNLDTIANNLANVNTTGFKQLRAEFQDLMYETYRASGAQAGNNARQPTALQLGLGTRFAATAGNFGQGSLQPTGNTFDIAITGSGFFRVQRPDGTMAYTRDGSFKLDATGALVTSDGYRVSPDITIPPGSTNVTIGQNGAISFKTPNSDTLQEVTPGLQLVNFPNPAGLTRIGQNLFVAGGGEGDPVEGNPGENGLGQVVQGSLEGSNVQVVEEMIRMITAQRAYEINSKAIQTSDDMLNTINNLKR